MGSTEKEIYAIVEPATKALGFELWGVEYLSQGKHSILRIYIDGANGINVDDCAVVSRQVSALLDVEDPIRGIYTLEVSSPGTDRPLFVAQHYEHYCGEMVSLQLRTPLEGQRKFQGRVLAVDAGTVTIETDGDELQIPLSEIVKGCLAPEW